MTVWRKRMSKIRVKPGAALMLCVMLMSDRADILALYFLSAVFHELGHLAAAKWLGIGVREISFDYSGVRICTDGAICSYRNEFLLALSGPLANFLVISISLFIFMLNRVSADGAIELCGRYLFDGEYSHLGAISFVALASFLQAMINLLPVKTFDGGRMAYCLSARLLGERAAERIIDIFSAFSAFILWTVALYLMLRISSGLGIYIFSATLFFSTVKANKKEA